MHVELIAETPFTRLTIDCYLESTIARISSDVGCLVNNGGRANSELGTRGMAL